MPKPATNAIIPHWNGSEGPCSQQINSITFSYIFYDLILIEFQCALNVCRKNLSKNRFLIKSGTFIQNVQTDISTHKRLGCSKNLTQLSSLHYHYSALTSLPCCRGFHVFFRVLTCFLLYINSPLLPGTHFHVYYPIII